jgi:hypothetical protein
MSDNMKRDAEAAAVKFLSSMRGQFIMSQALHYGIEAMEAVEPEYLREYSNIEDMKYLKDTLFSFYSPTIVLPHPHEIENEEENNG